MEVVINGCYGGFSLSYEAIKRIMERKGMECYAYSQKWTGNNFEKNYTRYNGGADLFYCFSEDLGDSISEDEISKVCNEEFCYTSYSFDKDEDRTDPDLIAVIKELGKAASGSCASLYIVKIPDEIPNGWYIDEYDGMESIEENHRSWS